MPIKLIPPRAGKTPFYAGRGTYLGKRVDRSTKTSDVRLAKKIIKQWERQIERGEFADKGELTFAGAAVAYMKAGGEQSRLVPLLKHFGETALSQIDQAAINNAAATLLPTQSAATRNREVYTPISAVLKHAGVEMEIKRPKGWRGVQRTDWLEPEQAFRVLAAADEVDKEFGIFLRVLCYTGLRLGEGLSLQIDKLDLSSAYVQVLNSKTGNIMGVFLPPVLIVALGNHPRGLDRPGQKVFRFVKCGRLYIWLRRIEAKAGVSGLGFHLFRHSWATWMRRYGGVDITGLLATERWADVVSARRYQHVVVSEEAKRAERLPVEQQWIRAK